MPTQKLYYENSLLTRFSARVLCCRPAGTNRWQVLLSATAFYPEGGGQPADGGALGPAAVLDVQEKQGEVWHTVDAPLEEGAEVQGEIDWPRRLDLMQQHTGEHILSGLLHRLYGADNVGFHIGEEFVTMDTSIELTAAQLAAAEWEANRIVWQNLPVEITCPSPAALESLAYRSKKSWKGRCVL